MEVITDHNRLLKMFHETQNELDELELNCSKISLCYSRCEDKHFSLLYGKDPSSSSSKYPLPEEYSTKQQKQKHDSSSDSSEESACEGEPPNKKATLQSAVITRKKVESRKDIICKQKKVQSRNRRILGMLQSTLQKFQDDAVKRQPQDLKRMRVEQKIEAAKENEEQRMEKERTELILKIKEKKLQLECLEQMMSITESFQTWKFNKSKSLNFLLTKAEPRIYYLPASHTQKTKRELEKSGLKTLGIIEKQENVLKEELARIKESFEAKKYMDETSDL